MRWAIKLYDADVSQPCSIWLAERALTIGLMTWVAPRLSSLSHKQALICGAALTFLADRVLVGIVAYQLWIPETNDPPPHLDCCCGGLSLAWIAAAGLLGTRFRGNPLVWCSAASIPILLVGRWSVTGSIPPPELRFPSDYAKEARQLISTINASVSLSRELQAAGITEDPSLQVCITAGKIALKEPTSAVQVNKARNDILIADACCRYRLLIQQAETKTTSLPSQIDNLQRKWAQKVGEYGSAQHSGAQNHRQSLLQLGSQLAAICEQGKSTLDYNNLNKQLQLLLIKLNELELLIKDTEAMLQRLYG